jgi:hypothetical protein
MADKTPTTTRPTINSGAGELPATIDVMDRKVPSEPPYTRIEVTPRDTHAITPNGSVPR